MLSISENESVGLIRVIGIHQMRRLSYRCIAGEVRDDVIQDVYVHLYKKDTVGKTILDNFDITKMDKGDGYVNKLGIYLSLVIRRFLINRMHKLDSKILFGQRSLDNSLASDVDVENQVIDSISVEKDDRNSKMYSAFRRLKKMPHESVGKRDRCLPTVSWFDMLRAFVTGKSNKELGKELGYTPDTVQRRRRRIGVFIFNIIGRSDLVTDSMSDCWELR
jgi:hypothetical protein